MERGGEGEEVGLGVTSGRGRASEGDDDCVCWFDDGLEASNMDAKVDMEDADGSGREIFRFLWRDVMKESALFPCGNKACGRKVVVLLGAYVLGGGG